MKSDKKEKPIELRRIINPNDSLYEFVSNVKQFLITDKGSIILDFILNRASKIPFSEFINIVDTTKNHSNPQKTVKT